MASHHSDISNHWDEFEDLNAKLRENIKLMTKQKENLASKRKDERQKAKKEVDRLYDETCKIFTYLSSLKHKSLKQREKQQNVLNHLCKNVDNESLGVKNFEYEQCDALKQIAICNDYKTHTKQPILVSKQEFYENNPQEQINDIHKEKTMRLQYELQQRKELQSNLRDITQRVKTLGDQLTEKNTFLNNLQSKIGNVFKAILPLQSYMNFPSNMLYPNESEINSLPAPLFAIYQSFITQIHCNNALDQKISIKISQRTNKQRNINNTNNSNKQTILGKRKYKEIKKTDSLSSSISPKQSTIGNETAHVKEESSNDNNNLEDGEIGIICNEPPRKRARTSNKSSKDNKEKKEKREKTRDKKEKKYRDRDRERSKSNKSKNESNNNNNNNNNIVMAERKEQKQNNNSNIMSVDVNNLMDGMQLNIEFKLIGIELEFMYCKKYNLILVAVKKDKDKYENPNVFMELFEGHKMIELPQIFANEKRFIENGAYVPYFSAFSWAQELGGSYIFNRSIDDKHKKRDIINLNTLEIALKLRKENRISLQHQIKQLMDNNNCQLFIQNVIHKALHDNSNKIMTVNKIISFKLVTDNTVQHSNKYSSCFRLILERLPFSLHCVIEIMASYPNKAPLFYVNNILDNNNNRKGNDYFVNECKNIEIKLNGSFNEYVNHENKHLLLSVMIYKLQTYFDIYVQSQTMNGNNNNICNQLSGSPIRIHRGRDRRQQY